jgi:hypothetical protein
VKQRITIYQRAKQGSLEIRVWPAAASSGSMVKVSARF